MKLFGLIGFPLTHSFSKKYFTEKFERESIKNHQYELFELPDIQELPNLFLNNPNLAGLNITIPHKQVVMPFLDSLDDSARKVGAVNVIKITADKKLIGYNSDYFGFKNSLVSYLTLNPSPEKGEGLFIKSYEKISFAFCLLPYHFCLKKPNKFSAWKFG